MLSGGNKTSSKYRLRLHSFITTVRITCVTQYVHYL